MRLRIRSSPACSDRCRCGISRASLAKASIRSRSASTESIEDKRSRLSSGTCLRICLHQRAELGRTGQIGAIARDVDAGQHDFAHSRWRRGGCTCVDDGAHRHRARVAAAVRDDAEGAAVVAAVLHLDKGARAAVECRRSNAARFPCTAMMSLTSAFVASATPKSARVRAQSFAAELLAHCRARDRPRAWPRRSAARSAPRSR